MIEGVQVDSTPGGSKIPSIISDKQIIEGRRKIVKYAPKLHQPKQEEIIAISSLSELESKGFIPSSFLVKYDHLGNVVLYANNNNQSIPADPVQQKQGAEQKAANDKKLGGMFQKPKSPLQYKNQKIIDQNKQLF